MRTKGPFELDAERLATTDASGHRVYLYPEEVHGKWKERRKLVYWGLIGLYLVLPWINVGDRPALQVDIFNREFTFLGSTLHGVEPIVFFTLLASGLFLMAFLTSLLGRVWCGWACPQTVFIQSIFWKIEQWVEGSARMRRQHDEAGLTLEQWGRRGIKWVLFLLVALHIAHTFIGYFVGPRTLLAITLHRPAEHWGLFTACMALTGIFLLDFGWFREQFCIIACPYGRIQSVMMDENSLVVAYDAKRGEPRFGTEGVSREESGDCVNCYNCVKVCPTGIDIRRGTQLECIACTQCIDACDEVMIKTKRAPGLIRYSSEVEIKGGRHRRLTARSGVYIAICLALVGAFFISLSATSRLGLVFLRAKTPFQVTSDRIVTNQFTLKAVHQGDQTLRFDLRIKDLAGVEVITPVQPVVADRAEKRAIVFFRFPKALLVSGTRKITVEAVEVGTERVISSREVTLVGPIR